MVMPAKPEEEKAIRVSFTLYQEAIDALAEEAKKRRMSRSTVLREIIMDWMERRSRQNNDK